MLPRFSGFLSPLSSIAPLHLFLCDLSTVFFFIFVSSEFPIGRRRCFYFLQVFNSWWESASPTCSSSTTGRGGDECGGQWEGQGVGLGVGPGGMELNWRVPFANWPAVRLASGPGRWPALGLNFFFLEIWRPFFLKTPVSFSIFFSLVLHCCSNAKKVSTCFFFPIASSPIGGSPPQVLFLSFFFVENLEWVDGFRFGWKAAAILPWNWKKKSQLAPFRFELQVPQLWVTTPNPLLLLVGRDPKSLRKAKKKESNWAGLGRQPDF